MNLCGVKSISTPVLLEELALEQRGLVILVGVRVGLLEVELLGVVPGGDVVVVDGLFELLVLGVDFVVGLVVVAIALLLLGEPAEVVDVVVLPAALSALEHAPFAPLVVLVVEELAGVEAGHLALVAAEYAPGLLGLDEVLVDTLGRAQLELPGFLLVLLVDVALGISEDLHDVAEVLQLPEAVGGVGQQSSGGTACHAYLL